MKIGILGAAGRMGQMIAREILSGHYDATLAAAVDGPQGQAIGKDIGLLLGLEAAGVTINADKEAAFAASDVLIDFTSPQGTMEHAMLASESGKGLLVGTTGLDAVAEAALKTAALKAPVLQSANTSLGVNLLVSLVKQAAAKLGTDYDIEIFEAHHRNKVDAPSGTALALGHAAAAGRGIKLEDAMIPSRFGHTGARITGSIGMSVFRGGDVIGDHTVTFAGAGERIELTHKASDRGLFARGAVQGAIWLGRQKPGLYTMQDMLGL